jgi:hypothetical protein
VRELKLLKEIEIKPERQTMQPTKLINQQLQK